MPKPRQLFLSQSEVLVQKVDKYYSKLELSAKIPTISTDELKKMAEERKLKRETGLFDDEEFIEFNQTVPKRYGALEDSHFPLFITYGHVSGLLLPSYFAPSSLITSDIALSALRKRV